MSFLIGPEEEEGRRGKAGAVQPAMLATNEKGKGGDGPLQMQLERPASFAHPRHSALGPIDHIHHHIAPSAQPSLLVNRTMRWLRGWPHSTCSAVMPAWPAIHSIWAAV